jgi:large subunit ribosomal protein L30
MMAGEYLEITQIKSGASCPKTQRLVLVGLGLRRMHKTVVRKNSPEVWGMIRKVPHLVRVKER